MGYFVVITTIKSSLFSFILRVIITLKFICVAFLITIDSTPLVLAVPSTIVVKVLPILAIFKAKCLAD